jgi:putative tricarboxylic transport membrane protein
VSAGAPGGAGVSGPGWRTLLGVGVALIAIAVAVLMDATRLPPPATVGVGPSAAMRLVAGFLAILGVAHGIAAWRQRAREIAGGPSPAPADYGNVKALAWVLSALLGLIVILELGGGFIAAATWLFVATARGFGERLSPKSIVAGLVLSSLIYFFFTRLLSLGLPAGPLERLLA